MSDVRRGHCWYCRKPGDKVPCSRCKIGVYCSQNCLGRDKRRHSSECQSFGPQKCNFCQKQLENRLECSGCGGVIYCNRSHQQQDWKNHRAECKDVKGDIVAVAKAMTITTESYANMKRLMDYPFYFGNTLALDFLRLTDNECAPSETDDEALSRNYSILSVGSGDLRNLVYTIASLPAAFKGSLNVTLCDFDPFVMARNVLFLYIMVADDSVGDVDKYLTSIWYSLQYTDKEEEIVSKALKKLGSCSTGDSLYELTGGLIEMEDEEVQVLRQVWEGWHEKRYIRYDRTDKNNMSSFDQSWHGFKSLGCDDKVESPLYRQRMRAVKNLRLREDHPFMQRYSSDMWVQNGKFTDGVNVRDLGHDNVTLTGRPGNDFSPRCKGGNSAYPYQSVVMDTHAIEHPHRCNRMLLEDSREPIDIAFVYCIQGDMNPYRVWDYLGAEASGYNDDMEPMYFRYIRKCIKSTVDFIRKKRLDVKTTITEARKLNLEDKTFDRIFTSNLQDYFGAHQMVRKFGPLLNRGNKHAVLVMETLHWVETVYSFNKQHFKGELKCLYERLYKQDESSYNQEYQKQLMERGDIASPPRYRPSIEDYDYDVADVIKYLKSLYLATEEGVNSKVPSTRTIMECDGLRMRDVRQGRNKVAPFRDVYRGRQGGIPGTERRTLEWFYPAPKDICTSDA
ncbi:uncharacterized protein [Amphiura filiformis]|uniref:uncharacterized protein isoform X1 n=1 Tax=Amphiura filiformis TaxID=82378 RepID=UPI003B21EDD6